MTATSRMVRRAVWSLTVALSGTRALGTATRVARVLPGVVLAAVEWLRLPFWSDLAHADAQLRRGEIFEYAVAVRPNGPVVVVHPSMSPFAQEQSR